MQSPPSPTNILAKRNENRERLTRKYRNCVTESQRMYWIGDSGDAWNGERGDRETYKNRWANNKFVEPSAGSNRPTGHVPLSLSSSPKKITRRETLEHTTGNYSSQSSFLRVFYKNFVFPICSNFSVYIAPALLSSVLILLYFLFRFLFFFQFCVSSTLSLFSLARQRRSKEHIKKQK